jgi:hypothetical protein
MIGMQGGTWVRAAHCGQVGELIYSREEKNYPIRQALYWETKTGSKFIPFCSCVFSTMATLNQGSDFQTCYTAFLGRLPS